MTKEIRHWCYSSITQFIRCPRQFYFQRIRGLPIHTTTVDQVLESAVHAGLATYHRQLRDDESIDLSKIDASFHRSWKQRTAQHELTLHHGDTIRDSIDLGLELLHIYLKEPPPEGIDSIESLFVAPIVTSNGEQLDRPLYAIADLITKTDVGLTIHEFKTVARSLSQQEVDAALQATCYTHTFRELFGQEATVNYVCFVKTKQPKIKRLITTRSMTDAGRLGDLVVSIERAIEAEAYYPIENPMNCSGCSYRKICRQWCSQAEPELISLSELGVAS